VESEIEKISEVLTPKKKQELTPEIIERLADALNEETNKDS